MYKLMAIDLDGTLLNSYGEVSAQTREASAKFFHEKHREILKFYPLLVFSPFLNNLFYSVCLHFT